MASIAETVGQPRASVPMRANLIVASGLRPNGKQWDAVAVGLYCMSVPGTGGFIDVALVCVIQVGPDDEGTHTLEIDVLDADMKSVGEPWPYRKAFSTDITNRVLVSKHRCVSIPARPGDYLFSVRVDGRQLTTYEFRVVIE